MNFTVTLKDGSKTLFKAPADADIPATITKLKADNPTWLRIKLIIHAPGE